MINYDPFTQWVNNPVIQKIKIRQIYRHWVGFSGGSVVKNTPANAGNTGDMYGLILGSGKHPGVGNGNLIQYFCRENPIDRGAWQATVHRVQKSQTRLSD